MRFLMLACLLIATSACAGEITTPPTAQRTPTVEELQQEIRVLQIELQDARNQRDALSSQLNDAVIASDVAARTAQTIQQQQPKK